MPKPIKKWPAKKVLKQAEPTQCFWVCDGAVLKDLRELAERLEKMSLEVFKYHCSGAKNDFAKWIGEVLNEVKLAKSILRAKTAKAMAKKIKANL